MLSLDDMMEAASQALARMDYLTCEALCLEALALARAQRDWAYYGRVLLPLQEARRHRRMIASEGAVRLGTTDLTGEASLWLGPLPDGCIVVTHPHGAAAAEALREAARQERRFVEVLLADNATVEATWTLRSFSGPAVNCQVPRPPGQWIDQWIKPVPGRTPQRQGGSAADWFIDATEALGDAALRQVDAQGRGGSEQEKNRGLRIADRGSGGSGSGGSGGERELAALEACLEVVTDHEIIHQRLGGVARALSLG